MIIYIFYPSYVTGGAEYLLLRASKFLAQKYNVCVLDFKEGWIATRIKEQEKFLISTKSIEEGKRITLKNEDILITSSNYLFELDKYFERSDAKIILWSMHPFNLIPMISGLPRIKRKKIDIPFIINSILCKPFLKKTKCFLESIKKNNSLYSVDGETDFTLRSYYGVSHTGYLPVIVDFGKYTPRSNKKLNNSIKVMWLGRLDNDFKIHILRRLIQDISALASDKDNEIDFRLTVIGDGPGKVLLENLQLPDKNLKVLLVGELHGEKLNDFISCSDIAFCMGTSAIETASRGCPTVLLDFSYSPVVGKYSYNFLHTVDDYSIGRNIERLSSIERSQGLSLEKLFSDFIKDTSYYSVNDYKYVTMHHSPASLESKLIEAVHTTSLDLASAIDFASMVRPFWRKKNNITSFIKLVLSKFK